MARNRNLPVKFHRVFHMKLNEIFMRYPIKNLPNKKGSDLSILTKSIFLAVRVGEFDSFTNSVAHVDLTADHILPSGGGGI